MRKLLICIGYIVCCAINAQEWETTEWELSLQSFAPQPFDVMTEPMQKTDLNGELCALVKVHLPIEGCQFEGNVVGTPIFSVNEYWVYMTRGSKCLNIKCPNCYTTRIDFEENGVSGLEKKTIYKLVINVPKSRLAVGNSFSLNNIDEALRPSIDIYKQGDFKRASEEFQKIKSSMSSKGITYKDLDEWINRCALALAYERFDVDESYPQQEGLYRIHTKDGYGYVDSIGNVVIEPQYDFASDFIDGVAVVAVGGYDKIYGLINSAGEYIVEPKYTGIHLSPYGVAWVEEDDKWGLVGKTGKLMLKPQYLYVMDKDQRYAVIAKKNTSVGYYSLYYSRLYEWKRGERGDNYGTSSMNVGGAYYVPESYDAMNSREAMPYTDWGLVDVLTGKFILDCKYMGCYQTSDYICFVDKNRNPIFIDPKTGKEKFSLPSGIKYIRPLFGNYAIISRVDKFCDRPNLVDSFHHGMTCLENLGLIDGNGNVIIPTEYSYIDIFDADFNPNLLTVEKTTRNDSYVALFDLDTKKYTRITIDDICESWDYRDKLFEHLRNNRAYVVRFESLGGAFPYGIVWVNDYVTYFGILDINTHKLLTPLLNSGTGDYVLNKDEENYVFKSYDKNSPIVLKDDWKNYKIYSKEGNIHTIPSDVKVEDGFSYGRALVKQGGHYGYIDEKGKLVIPCKYEYAKNFAEKDGAICAEVRENYSEPSKYIDICGNEITK